MPDLDAGIYGLAYAFKAEGKPAAGEQVMRQALRIDPTSTNVYYGLGDMLLEQDKVAASLPFYRKTVQLFPNH